MATGKFRMVSDPKSGIGGFLLFFVVIQVISIGLVAWHIPGTIAALFGPDAVAAGVVLFFQAGRAVAYIMGLVLLFRRDPRIRTIIACLIWFFYWRMSERVRLTFAPKTS